MFDILLTDFLSAHSCEITKSRLEVLKTREAGIEHTLAQSKAELIKLSSSPQYKDLLVKLIIQVR